MPYAFALGFPDAFGQKARDFPMPAITHSPLPRSRRSGPAVKLVLGLTLAFAAALALVGPARLLAQIEGERGIAPVASTGDIEINGITVETTGKTAEEARVAGWKEAQKKGWAALKGPAMGAGAIESMVSAVVIENEQLGPHRYFATLGVIFDRARAGQYLAGKGARAHSAPMLVLPLLYSGGTAQLYEVRGDWQRAWAEFRAGASAIDYVRPAGSGGDSLLLTEGQMTRRSRSWWRNVLDQFDAADVIMPVARLERQWPGGPIRGTFTARYGPDSTYLETFTLTANDEAGLRAMLNAAILRFDQIYSGALASGLLRPDPTLNTDRPVLDPALIALIAAGQADAAPKPAPSASADASPSASAGLSAPATTAAAVSSYTVQFASPDAAAVDAALASVRGTAGVSGASTTSIAIGGTSVMRVAYAGEIESLRGALQARGWQVSAGAGALSIKR